MEHDVQVDYHTSADSHGARHGGSTPTTLPNPTGRPRLSVPASSANTGTDSDGDMLYAPMPGQCTCLAPRLYPSHAYAHAHAHAHAAWCLAKWFGAGGWQRPRAPGCAHARAARGRGRSAHSSNAAS